MEQEIDKVKEASVWVLGGAFATGVFLSVFLTPPIGTVLFVATVASGVFILKDVYKPLNFIERCIRKVTGIKDIDTDSKQVEKFIIENDGEHISEEYIIDTMKINEIFGESDADKKIQIVEYDETMHQILNRKTDVKKA